MHQGLTQALFEMFPQGEKGDFYHAYMYLKHLDHFMYHALKTARWGRSEAYLTEEILSDIAKTQVVFPTHSRTHGLMSSGSTHAREGQNLEPTPSGFA